MVKKVKDNNLTGAFNLFPKSVEVIKRNINTFVLLWILPAIWVIITSKDYITSGNDKKILHTGSQSWFSGLPAYAIVSIVGIGVLFFVLFVIVSLIIQTMTYTLQLEGAEGKTPPLDHLWKIAKKFWLRILGLSVVTGLLIIGGLILLIIPGLIAIRRYYLAPYFMIDQDSTITEALKKSAAKSKPYSREIWYVIGVTILLSFAGVMPVIGAGVAFLLTSLYSVAPALRYQEIK